MCSSDLYQQTGNQSETANIYNRMLSQENSPYETIKGIPELVDTNYCYAHSYFGDQLLAQKNYQEALDHFKQAAERLERWRKGGQFLQIAKASGMLSDKEEQEKLDLLRECYDNMATCYSELGKYSEASDARSLSLAVK